MTAVQAEAQPLLDRCAKMKADYAVLRPGLQARISENKDAFAKLMQKIATIQANDKAKGMTSGDRPTPVQLDRAKGSEAAQCGIDGLQNPSFNAFACIAASEKAAAVAKEMMVWGDGYRALSCPGKISD